MRTHRALPAAFSLALLVALTACDAVDRARARIDTTSTDSLSAVGTGSGLMLGLQVPGPLRPGEEGSVRLSITNRSDTVASRMELELVVPGWVEPMPPRPGDREVSMAALSDGGIRFAYQMADTPLDPNRTETIEQRIRLPAPGPTAGGAVPWTRVVRARLLGANGEPLVEVESEIALIEGPRPDTAAPAGTATPTSAYDTAPGRDRLGPITLGMRSDALRRSVPTARDTTWMQEGMAQSVVNVPLGAGERAHAVFSGDSVMRIEVRDPAVRTREQLGVGSSMGDLRAAFGRPCVDAAEGTVVVWFASAPGISFALDMPVPQNLQQLRQSPDQIPANARVTRWWLRRGVDSCPA